MKTCIDCYSNNQRNKSLVFIGAQCQECYDKNPITNKADEGDMLRIDAAIKAKRRKEVISDSGGRLKFCGCGRFIKAEKDKCWKCTAEDERLELINRRLISYKKFPETKLCLKCKDVLHISNFYLKKKGVRLYPFPRCKKEGSEVIPISKM
jgi:hypothetical protein